MTDSPSPLTVNRRRLATILGCSVRHLADLEASGIITPARRGKGGRESLYAVDAAVPTYLAHATQAPANFGEREARARRDASQAALNELRLQREQGTLIAREDVVLAGRAMVLAWSGALRALPHQLVQTGVITIEQRAGVAASLKTLLTTIANWRAIPKAVVAQIAREDRAAVKAGASPRPRVRRPRR